MRCSNLLKIQHKCQGIRLVNVEIPSGDTSDVASAKLKSKSDDSQFLATEKEFFRISRKQTIEIVEILMQRVRLR